MKRIIEIPDKVVEAIQNGEDYRYDIHTAIAQSTPYNPSGDAISREALKEQVKNEVCEVCFDSPDERQCSPNCKLCTFKQLIDNAPTVPQVTVFTETADEKAKADLKAELQNVIEARPQGEWVPTTSGGMCPFCGQVSPNGFTQCGYCGALMKGGADMRGEEE